jgi:hypothetical protein
MTHSALLAAFAYQQLEMGCRMQNPDSCNVSRDNLMRISDRHRQLVLISSHNELETKGIVKYCVISEVTSMFQS